MISEEHLAQLRALIEAILEERGIKRVPQDITEKRRAAAMVRWARKRAIAMDANAMQKHEAVSPHKHKGSHANAMQVHRACKPIGDGEVICVCNGLYGPVEVRQSYVRELIDAYPGVMVAQEIDRARLWLDDNPAKRKANVRRFLTGWIRRKQG